MNRGRIAARSSITKSFWLSRAVRSLEHDNGRLEEGLRMFFENQRADPLSISPEFDSYRVWAEGHRRWYPSHITDEERRTPSDPWHYRRGWSLHSAGFPLHLADKLSGSGIEFVDDLVDIPERYLRVGCKLTGSELRVARSVIESLQLDEFVTAEPALWLFWRHNTSVKIHPDPTGWTAGYDGQVLSPTSGQARWKAYQWYQRHYEPPKKDSGGRTSFRKGHTLSICLQYALEQPEAIQPC